MDNNTNLIYISTFSPSVVERVITVADDILKHNNTSFHQQSHNSTTCLPQNDKFALIYTLAVVFNGLSTLFNGYLLDRFGTCFCRVFGM